ncbi:MAG: sulfotransferase family 2 domain-containing protein [Thermosynechococcaceae cyanobacterium]
MAIICRSYKILFIMTPRTACSAVGKSLCENLDGVFLPSSEILNDQGNIQIQKKHNTLQQILDNKLLTEEEVNSFLKFTCVRNPFDSLASLYEKKRTKYQPLLSDPTSWVYKVSSGYAKDMEYCSTHSFDEWIFKKYKPNLIKKTLGRGRRSLFGKYTKGIDIIMRFENIQDEFKNVLKEAGITKEVPLLYFNQTDEKTESYQEYYSEASKRVVEYVFHDDLKLYDYGF